MNTPTVPPTITLADHLRIAELPVEHQESEQRRLARIRALRRALARTPKGDPLAKEY